MNKWFLPLCILFSIVVNAQSFTTSYDHRAILVEDLDVSVDFYMEVLQFKEIENKTEQAHIRWLATGPGNSLHIIEESGHKNKEVKGVHMAFRVDDLDAFVAHLKTIGLYFENWQGVAKTTNPRPDGIRQVYFQDPDGYWIEVNGI